jgi:hypothetical protein
MLAEGEEEEEEEGSEGALTAQGYWGSPLKQGSKARLPLNYAGESGDSGSEGEQEVGTRSSSFAARHSGRSTGGGPAAAAAEGQPPPPAAGPAPGFSASGLTSFKEISRKISAGGGISDLGRAGSGFADPSVDAATAAAAAAAVGLTLEDSSLALAAALDGEEMLPGSELQEGGGGGESDFTIASVPDVSTRPSSGRLSRRSSRGLTAQVGPGLGRHQQVHDTDADTQQVLLGAGMQQPLYHMRGKVPA